MQLASIPGKELDDANVRLVVIGCGSWDLIPSYKGENRLCSRNAADWTQRADLHQEITGFNGEVFADPSRSTFRTLELITGLQGLTLTPSSQKRKSYMTRVTKSTIIYGLKNFIVGCCRARMMIWRSAHE